MSETAETTNDNLKSAWLIKPDLAIEFDGLQISVTSGRTDLSAVQANDGVIVMRTDGSILGVGKVFRVRQELYKNHIYFSAFFTSENLIELGGLGIKPLVNAELFRRLLWPEFERAATSICKMPFSSLPTIKGTSPFEQAYVRELLFLSTKDDLLGPANGPFEEIVGMSVRDRYLIGKLAPRETLQSEEQNEELIGTAGTTDADSGPPEAETASNRSLVPSSIGLTFCVDAELASLEVQANWGRYERGESELAEPNEEGRRPRAWRRLPSGGKIKIPMKKGDLEPIVIDDESPLVTIQGTIRDPRPNGDRLITLFLVNNQELPEENQDAAWLFQPELIVRDPNGKPVFRKKPILESSGHDSERDSLEMIYREQVEYAVGHGTSVHCTSAPNEIERAIEVRTIVLPEFQVPVTETPGLRAEDRKDQKLMVERGYLDMKSLANAEVNELQKILQLLTDDYDAWIKDQKVRVPAELSDYSSVADEALEKCEDVLKRLRAGVEVLSRDPKALEAFRFANSAMAIQRVRSIYSLKKRRGEEVTFDDLDIPKNRSWRSFQLAFMLMSIPSLADPLHEDRTGSIDALADLLWFPTGGGKTEAYLGVAAFAMAVRRLQGNLGGFDSSRGLTVIMRYTLRLLTLQQFQRATALICAMESIRRADVSKWGHNRFSIGLWVGQKSTPNTTEESHQIIEAERNGNRTGTSTPAQLTSCPWCGSEIIAGRDIFVSKDFGQTIIYCGDKYSQCEFGKVKSKDVGLPVIVVDEEIYRRPPSMLIATVDKFAMMAWKGQTRTLFGVAEQRCDRHGLLWPDAKCTGTHQKKGTLPSIRPKAIPNIRPPDLIIQDEFHLISGPLGTMVGLYETAIDQLSSWRLDGKTIRPKVIASTATVRKAREQVNNVFLRKVLVFPPHGLEITDNYFSVQRPIETQPGRKYVGICAPGSSRPAVLIRLYVALLTGAQAIYEQFGEVADPYMTLVGYFNSLRELGGMKRLAEDDVQTRSYRVQMSRSIVRPGLSQRSVKNIDELTSRVSSKDIPRKLDQLEVKYKKNWQRGETRCIDVVLATNMLSVGVDVNRLGLMVVNGQPKSTAEYIQATSRVGRSFPGLVFTALTWSRPRDLSHYESFEHYHATFYKHVEAQSVTPFAPRAMDRGLTGAMVSMIRLSAEGFNPNLGAESMNAPALAVAEFAKAAFANRAWKVTDKKSMGQFTDAMIADRIDRWIREATRGGRRLTYDLTRDQDDAKALLNKPGIQNWEVFTAPTSMREVEPGVRIIMDDSRIGEMPEWKIKLRRENTDSSEGDL